MNAVKLFFSYFILLNLVSCDFLGLESTRDYFPINIGNSWTFSFWFKPISWDDEKYEGELIWEIVNIGKGNSRTIELLETINGKRTTYNYNTNKNETTTVNRQNIINFIVESDFIKITKPNFFNRELMFRKKFESSEAEILIRNDREVDRPTDNLVSLDGEWDMIFLKKYVGIKQWGLRNSHNSGPRGNLLLVDYKINGRLY